MIQKIKKIMSHTDLVKNESKITTHTM